MLCHLSALCLYVGVPFGHIIGPLFVWLAKRGEFDRVDDQGRESLNFQLSVTVYALLIAPLMFIGIGYLLIAALAAFHFVFTVVAAVKASGGTRYRYPLAIRFIR